MKLFARSFIAAAFCTLALAGSALAESQSFSNPKVGGQRLDICLTWGADCGKPAADAWCASKGFENSTNHAIASDIGATTPTRLLSTGALCDQDFCDGFSQITCFKASPASQTYVKPKFNGKRLDLCVDWGVGCGAPAADKFCESKGWAKSGGHIVANNIGAYSPTRLIGTGAICDQEFCDGFKTIKCEN
jgi:hypothetical protein